MVTTNLPFIAELGPYLRSRIRHSSETPGRRWQQPWTTLLRGRLRLAMRSEPRTCLLRQDQPAPAQPKATGIRHLLSSCGAMVQNMQRWWRLSSNRFESVNADGEMTRYRRW